MELTLQGVCEDFPELKEAGCTGSVIGKIKVLPTPSTIVFQAEFTGIIHLECARCIEKLEQPFKVKARIFLEMKDSQGLEWVESEEQGVEEYMIRVGPNVTNIPLEHLIAEQIILNYNPSPIPPLDAQNNCMVCGRADFLPTSQSREDKNDPRWEKLKNLRDRNSSGSDSKNL